MKFLVGMLLGVVIGMLTLISTIAAFIAGLVLGWKAFSDDDDDDKSESLKNLDDRLARERASKEPSTGPGHVAYSDMTRESTTQEETPET